MTTNLTTRLRALGIEPGEAACDYELRAQESNLIPRLSCDAALDELATALEDADAAIKAAADRLLVLTACDEPVCEKCGARVSVDFALCGRCVDLERAEAERGKADERYHAFTQEGEDE